MTKYYCSKCSGYHSKGKKYKEHKDFAIELSQSEIFKQRFRKSWNRYNIDSHKKTSGSKAQIQKSNFSKICSK